MEHDQLSHDLASLKLDRGAPPTRRRWPRLLGAASGDGRELVTKLPPGTKVVLDPPADLGDGEKVKENK